MPLSRFKLPNVNTLYGRIFAIFWFTMLLVLIAVLSLPHLDPRKAHNIPDGPYQRILQLRDDVQKEYQQQTNLEHILLSIEGRREHKHDPRPRIFFSDYDGKVLTTDNRKNFHLRAMQNFVSIIEDNQQPKQKLYGRYMIAGPVPITLAGTDILMYVGFKWNQPPPFLLQLFDHPVQLLLAVMLVSTPLLLWLAWALSLPARRLEAAAQRVAKGEFVTDPNLEKGTTEFRQAGSSFNQMVEAVNQIISGQQRLLSDISHELRSPLTRLRMASALATRKQGESPELARIDTESQRLEQMISELLALSRMQANSHMTRETQPIQSLWEEIIKDSQFEAEQMGKQLRYSTLPKGSISGNPKLLMSAVENIIRNAIYYGKDEVEVAIKTQGNTLYITVDDNGEGVPDSELEAIFRPFYRVSTARDRHSGGAGLGLTITESAVRQHSGTIKASRSPLGGLRVAIALPLVKAGK
ncbi:envelope stress sensor histidine kinase CpxA [Vibrio mytili]|uniref:envelope stress sensor histidine kinase CpxA n=1 Tax=Vibrio mytili TaxID=50718 RepID=UPI003C6EDEB6